MCKAGLGSLEGLELTIPEAGGSLRLGILRRWGIPGAGVHLGGGQDPEHPVGVSWNWLGHFRGLGYPWGFDTLGLWCWSREPSSPWTFWPPDEQKTHIPLQILSRWRQTRDSASSEGNSNAALRGWGIPRGMWVPGAGVGYCRKLGYSQAGGP